MKTSILYVCNLNAVRSVLAEYITNKHYGETVSAQSCGVIAGPPDGYAASIGLEHQIDITEHESRYLSDVDISQFDEIISFSLDAFQEVERLDLPSAVKIAHWEVRDFAGIGHNRDERLEVYRGLFDEIATLINGHFKRENG